MGHGAVLVRAPGVVALGALIAGLSRGAAAEPAPDSRAQLPALLQAGADASKAKHWEACIEAYSRAAAIEEAPATLGELGLCEEGAGSYARAHPHLKNAAAAFPPDHALRKRYQAALARVAQDVAIVLVTTTPTDARLVVDGRPLGPGDGRNIAVEPGRHVFAARLPGYKDTAKTITVNARDMPNVELLLEPVPAPELPAPKVLPAILPPAAPRSPARDGGSASLLPLPLRWCVPAWSARGVLGPAACAGVLAGAVSLGTWIGFDVHYSSMRPGLDARGFTAATCAPGSPSAGSVECEDIFARREQRNTALGVLIGTGIAAGALVVATGVAIMVEPLGPRVAATAGKDGGGVVLQGTW